MRKALLTLFAAPLVAASSPAHAAGGSVELSSAYRVVTASGVHHVVVECDATANPGSDGDLAAITVVTCTINGTAVAVAGEPTTMSAPGSKVAIVVAANVMGRVTICRSGSATFLDFVSNVTYTVDHPPECAVVVG